MAFKDDTQPMYELGDRVMMTNPLDFFGAEDTKVYTITDVKFAKVHGTHAYKLDNGAVWVNEAWLEPDIFGPQFIAEDSAEIERKQLRLAILAEQDYELASLFDAVETRDEAEILRSKARLTEIHSELEALK